MSRIPFMLALALAGALVQPAAAQDGATILLPVAPAASAPEGVAILPLLTRYQVAPAALVGARLSDSAGVPIGRITEIRRVPSNLGSAIGVEFALVENGTGAAMVAPLSGLVFGHDLTEARLDGPLGGLEHAATAELGQRADFGTVPVRRMAGAGALANGPMALLPRRSVAAMEPQSLLGRTVTDPTGARIGAVEGVVGSAGGGQPDRLIVRAAGPFAELTGYRSLPLSTLSATPDGRIRTDAWAQSESFAFDGSTRVYAR